ncbi:Polysaccharide deacetylase [Dissulfuribacter thermophilus]|uniref:Polysaccharide deacetylase n=1 Tax=Dissulfuribacter thermophilus TaxID=1156395 RepID=A0A1B9F401_9BACT|nr:polysaccharide deacetylase family protein [Dissulfuribacter thermophilus]OCC14656.1 Polysaccharide deacetylase [Dissulfuribacter thermophilus]
MFISLLFHRIVNDKNSELIDVTKESFERYLTTIIDKSLPLETIYNLCKKSKNTYSAKFVSLTFDDGWASDYKIVFSILSKYSVKATFFITTGWLGKKGFLTESWLKEMAQYGMEIGSHTVTHRYLTKLSNFEIYKEFYDSKCKLEDILGKEIISVSIPGGEYNKRIIDLAFESGYKIIATSRPGWNRNNKVISRISIHARTSLEDFSAIVNFSSSYRVRLLVHYRLRSILKKALGIEQYKKIRKYLIKDFSCCH